MNQRRYYAVSMLQSHACQGAPQKWKDTYIHPAGCNSGEWHNKGHSRRRNGFMDDERLNVLCEELRSLARQSPGINPSSTLRVSAISHEIQRSVDSTDVREDAGHLVDGFQLWFSPRKWNRSGDEGRHLKFEIFTSILKLEGAMRQIHRSRINPIRASHR